MRVFILTNLHIVICMPFMFQMKHIYQIAYSNHLLKTIFVPHRSLYVQFKPAQCPSYFILNVLTSPNQDRWVYGRTCCDHFFFKQHWVYLINFEVIQKRWRQTDHKLHIENNRCVYVEAKKGLINTKASKKKSWPQFKGRNHWQIYENTRDRFHIDFSGYVPWCPAFFFFCMP